MWHQFLMNSENSLSKIVTIQSNSGNVLVIVNGLFIKLSIRKLKNSILNSVILASLHKTSVRRVNVMTFLWNGRWLFKHQTKKGHQFLELLNDDNKPLEPTYSKGRSWLKYFGYSTSLCTRATRAIVNYALISKYWLRFFLWEEFKCLYGTYSIETRHHILFDCKRYDKYWNLRRDTISYFMLFLEFNSSVFTFRESIT